MLFLACGAGEWDADCVGCCHCKTNNQCNAITAECLNDEPCADCWTGFNCQQSKDFFKIIKLFNFFLRISNL